MDLDSLIPTSGSWLQGTGPDADIVVSSRIRLARNLARFPFISRADDELRQEIETLLREQIMGLPDAPPFHYLNVADLEPIDRQFLVERQLISREHADSQGSRGVAISDEEHVSLMINEEDHLRIQVLQSGLS
ncbi:MAG: ATP--guanido phosphotransferase, partial [Planctomycetota bacterium]|nr:ATP--guanido phosphotransferase [Planctomycetota bacterium]